MISKMSASIEEAQEHGEGLDEENEGAFANLWQAEGCDTCHIMAY